MMTKRNMGLTWKPSAAVFASLMALAGCADVTDRAEDELPYDDDALAQLADAGEATDDAGEATDDAATSSSETAADAGPRWAQREDQGKGDGSDVIMIGDSWMTMYGGGLQAGINASNGATTYRGYGVAGKKLLSGTGPIPTQFTRASSTNKNIRTVIMTGGGNDVLLSPSATAACRDPSCATLQAIKNGLVALWETMAKAGVKDVVYIGYSEGAGSSPAVVTNVSKNGVSKACDEIASINCHWIDSTPIIRGRLQDGIHPTGAAHKDLGAAVYKLMEEHNVRR